jgi:hypothetical protein
MLARVAQLRANGADERLLAQLVLAFALWWDD